MRRQQQQQQQHETSITLYPEQSFDAVLNDLYQRHDKDKILKWIGIRSKQDKDKDKMTFKTFFRQGLKWAPLCDEIHKKENANTTLIHFKMDCWKLFHKMGSGTGNIINTMLNARLQARVLGLDFLFTCQDANDPAVYTTLPTPWMTGYFPAQATTTTTTTTTSSNDNKLYNLTQTDVCVPFNHVPIGYVVKEFQYELRRMAIALVGVPPTHHATHDAAKHFYETLLQTHQVPNPNVLQLHDDNNNNNNNVTMPAKLPYPDFVPDHVAIHFRCGDLATNAHAMYALLPFSYYSRDISPAATRIGILTSPFEQSEFNRDETQYSDKCRILVYGLVDYLQARFPQAAVSVHNQPNETLALSYARLVMANQSFVSISTFGVFPAAATFGTGYFYQPPANFEASALWTALPPGLDALTDNVVVTAAVPRISTLAIRDHWNDGKGNGNTILQWLTNDSVTQDWLQ